MVKNKIVFKPLSEIKEKNRVSFENLIQHVVGRKKYSVRNEFNRRVWYLDSYIGKNPNGKSIWLCLSENSGSLSVSLISETKGTEIIVSGSVDYKRSTISKNIAVIKEIVRDWIDEGKIK